MEPYLPCSRWSSWYARSLFVHLGKMGLCLRLWVIAVFHGLVAGTVLAAFYLATSLAGFVNGIFIFLAYLLKLTMATLILAPLLGHFAHLGGHAVGGELPRTGIIASLGSAILAALLLAVSVCAVPIQLLLFLVDIWWVLMKGRMPLYSKTYEGLFLHRWLFKTLHSNRLKPTAYLPQ